MFKVIKMIAVVMALGLAVAACSKVPAGNVGVKVYLLGTSKGVDQEQLGPGRYWIGWNEELYLFPTFTQNYVWTMDSTTGSRDDESLKFQDRDGMTISADVGITYELNPDKIPDLFQRFRLGITEITDGFLRNQVRDAFVRQASLRTIDQIYGEGKTDFMKEVEVAVRKNIEPLGINLINLYLISELRLPPQILEAVNMKLEANQRALLRENEIAQTKAEAQKAIEQSRGEAESYRISVEGRAKANATQILTEAQARAEANELIARSVTPELTRYNEVNQWNGVLPTTMLGSGGSSNLLLSLQPR